METQKSNFSQYSAHQKGGGALPQKVRWSTSVTFGEVLSFMLIISHQVMASTQLFLTDTEIHHPPKIMRTQEEVSIRGTVQMFNAMFQQRSILNNFLSSSTNKSCFIYMLSRYLIKSGNKVITSDEDGDMENS